MQDLYDEVDDNGYEQVDEDFVEDDDNAGYIDNGIDEQHFSDEYDEPDEGIFGQYKIKVRPNS